MATMAHPVLPSRLAPPPIRLLIVDDSAVARAVLGRLIDGSDRWVVARAVPTVEAALAFLAHASVDFILLDVHMPGIDGLSALPDLIAAAPRAKVIVVSSAAAAKVQALALGAVDALTKPGSSGYTRQFGAALLDTLARLTDDGEREAIAPEQRKPLEPVRDSLRAESPAASPRLQTRFPARILVAEDNPVNQKVAIATLKKLGYQPHVVANGNEALDALREMSFDLILMDCR